MTLVVSGMLSKQVGDELGIGEVTVKFHRGNLMQKMKADSFAELVNMATRLRLTHASKAKAPGVL
jgi:FixJ family two-component response regulator